MTAFYEPDYVEFQLADSRRVFTTLESSLGPAPHRIMRRQRLGGLLNEYHPAA